MSRPSSDDPTPKVNSAHPLVGLWVEEGDPEVTTTVTYKIEVRMGRFFVTGIDQSNGIRLDIGDVTWDGQTLRFWSLYPPTQHRAAHELMIIEKARASHKVDYLDDDGLVSAVEYWIKATGNRSARGEP